MGVLVTVEGLDGAGKRTLSTALTAELASRGLRVGATAFPRYGRSVHADLVSEALHGKVGDLGDSVHGMAVLFALDRAEAVPELTEMLASNDVVLLDRYAASNAAFGAARLHQDARGEFAEWIRQLEFDRLRLPAPTLQVLLRVPVAVATARAADRESADAGRARDAFERDAGLQERTGAVYEGLAADGWAGAWHVHEQPDAADTAAPAGAAVAAVTALADRVLAGADA
ncbi:dTMP kinase [Rhodococcus sp. X156]|uniref:dTMP kinase n=1 Tax=Rhodococcus sp. X156 TaxID=2499145 RepID=UPI000FD74572|nr:dTMP kinase [Rhodococcus sp. X156]